MWEGGLRRHFGASVVAGPGFETTCPVCAHVFDVPADAPEAPCPSCRSIIEFAEPEDLEQQQRRLEAERAARDEAKRLSLIHI